MNNQVFKLMTGNPSRISPTDNKIIAPTPILINVMTNGLIFLSRLIFLPNMAEIELHVLNGQCLNRHIPTMIKVKEEVGAWENHRNNKASSINWQFTTKESRIKLKRLYPSIHD